MIFSTKKPEHIDPSASPKQGEHGKRIHMGKSSNIGPYKIVSQHPQLFWHRFAMSKGQKSG